MPEEKNSKDQKVIEKAAKLILGTDAMSRFTRTPINIDNLGGHLKGLVNALSGIGISAHIEGDSPKEQPSTGEYTMGTPGQINVTSYNSIPNYSDIVGTIHHEDIHALLDKAKYTYPPLGGLSDMLISNPVIKATEALEAAGRAGDLQTQEVPAYVGAYKPAEMPGFTEADRQRYLSRIMPTLQPNTANLLQRIVQSFNASQNPPF